MTSTVKCQSNTFTIKCDQNFEMRESRISVERELFKKFFVITDSLIAIRLTLVSLASHSRHHGVAPRSLVLQRGHQGESSGRSVIVIVNPADSAALSAAATRRVHPAVQRMTHLSELLDVRQGACPGHQCTTLQFTLVSNAYIWSRHNLTSPNRHPDSYLQRTRGGQPAVHAVKDRVVIFTQQLLSHAPFRPLFLRLC